MMKMGVSLVAVRMFDFAFEAIVTYLAANDQFQTLIDLSLIRTNNEIDNR